MFGPEEALRLGYVDRVADAADLDQIVRAEASRLRQLDMQSYTATKARINERALVAIRAAVEAEARDVGHDATSRSVGNS